MRISDWSSDVCSSDLEAIYGLTEIHRDAIRGSRLCANPGCYPTTSELPLVPLIEAGLIEADEIVIDAKSGVSGAGRSEKQQNLHAGENGRAPCRARGCPYV